MSCLKEKCVSTYEKLSQVPTISSIKVLNDDKNQKYLHWQLTSTCRDLAREKTVSYKVCGSFNREDETVTKLPFTTEVTYELISAYSTCGHFKAIINQHKQDESCNQYLEIWDGNTKKYSVDLTAANKHGLVHNNPMFGCLEWSHDKSTIVYVAEKVSKKSLDFSFLKKSDDNESDEQKDKFLFDDNWGEQIYKCQNPTICLFDVESKSIINLSDQMPKDVSISKAYWSKDDKVLYLTGYHSQPYRLGLVYCHNRPSAIYAYHLKNKILKPVVDKKDCIYSMIVNQKRDKIIYLQTKSLQAHSQCAKLMSISVKSTDDLEFTSPTVVYDIVKESQLENGFNGFFVDSIPLDCWLSDKEIVFHSQYRSQVGLFVINIETSKIKQLETKGQWKLLCVKDQVLFVVHSQPNLTPTLMIGKINHSSYKIKWNIAEQSNIDLKDIKWSILTHKPTLISKNFPNVTFESVLITPKDTTKLSGLIVNPHGGPHGCYPAAFSLDTAYFVRQNFAVLRVNYRGSTGFGQDGIESLLGEIGRIDVSDVQQSAIEVQQMLKCSNVFVTGGSHGGFLTLHLIAQYPEFYKAATTRNPVSNVVANVVASDIPDWSYVECGINFNYGIKPTAEHYSIMLNKSPVALAKHIKTPLILMLGSVDLRVPPYQSIELYKMLKSQGNEVKVYMYEGNNHPICEVDAEASCFINTVLWFLKHGSDPKTICSE